MSARKQLMSCGRSLRTVAALTLTLAMTSSLAARECVWNGGSGHWGDSAGWKDGIMPSAAGDTVVIAGDDVMVTVEDADIANFQLVEAMTVEDAGSQLVIDTSSTEPVDVPAVFSGKGTLVKKGSATVNLTTAGDHYLSLLGRLDGGLVVSNGTVQLPDRSKALGYPDDWLYVTRVEVSGSGVLSLGNVPSFYVMDGLWGDGTITNPNTGCVLNLVCRDHENPPVFSGHFVPNVVLRPRFENGEPSVQYLTGITECDLDVELGGILGVKTLGMKDSPGSLGTGFVHFRYPVGGLYFLNEEDETSDKRFRFWGAGALVRFNAGTRGGMTFTGQWDLPAYTAFSPYRYNTIVLEGENTERACVVSVIGMYDDDDRSTVYWRKEGAGIWRFADIKPDIHGTFEIRRGTLEFDTLAEKGVPCALGLATRTGIDVSHLPDGQRVTANVPRVAYAYRLGNAEEVPLNPDDDHLPTMRYVGADAAICTTRPFVVDGIGRILSAEGSLSLAGVSAFTSGTHTLVLDGDGLTANQFASITNGPLGTINVVKRGSGLWTLTDDICAGVVAAEQGTLRVGASYSFYRWTITANNKGYGDCWIASFQGFAMMDENGVVVNGSLGQTPMQTDKLDHPELLLPGQMCYGRANYANDGCPVGNAFDWDPVGQDFRSAEEGQINVTVKKDDESTHPIVYFRLDEGVMAAKYDVMAMSHNRDAVCWELAGSTDGKNWDVLHVRETNYVSNLKKEDWHSTGSSTRGGWDIATGCANATFDIAAVGAAQGATLEFVGNAVGTVVSNIVLSANGGGSIRGATIARNGTVDVTSFDRSLYDTEIPLDLTGCIDSANVGNWKLRLNGEFVRNRLGVTATGVTVHRNGFNIIVR